MFLRTRCREIPVPIMVRLRSGQGVRCRFSGGTSNRLFSRGLCRLRSISAGATCWLRPASAIAESSVPATPAARRRQHQEFRTRTNRRGRCWRRFDDRFRQCFVVKDVKVLHSLQKQFVSNVCGGLRTKRLSQGDFVQPIGSRQPEIIADDVATGDTVDSVASKTVRG